MIRCEQVTFGYGGGTALPVLKDFSLTIPTGEELVVIGGNGSGKTTLGLLLCGILTPTSGRIIVEPASQRRNGDESGIGFLFQDPDNGLVATTVEREVAFSLENRNLPTETIQREVAETLDRFRLTRFRERLVWTLSGGEKQRLSLAALFAAGSNILFLDEPESYLDYDSARQLEQTLKELRSANPDFTIIRVTQYPRVAERYHRMVILGEGAIIGDDSPEALFSNQIVMARSRLRPPLKYFQPRSSLPTPAIIEDKQREPLVEITDLAFTYDSNLPGLLFDNLSLTIRRGEVLALVGASGSGKSTLAQLICGLYQPVSGVIHFTSPETRAVMTFQQPERQFFLDTAFAEVAYGIRKRGLDADRLSAAVQSSMEMAGLDFDLFCHRDPHSLSGGEARRLAFAVIVALQAELIIFDEPTCALDEFGVRSFKRMTDRLRQEAKTVVIITHNSDIIGELADRIAVLADGAIKAVMDPLTFFTSPESEKLLPTPEVIRYQRERFGRVATTRPADIFSLDEFSA
ncbi:MAG: ATP-binding cassette domain-containing protein [candidate division Zixibacteria bacterium]|nr:ATP-binding cassette domain-containing protein [candidate division Zixibacteria bacterium]